MIISKEWTFYLQQKTCLKVRFSFICVCTCMHVCMSKHQCACVCIWASCTHAHTQVFICWKEAADWIRSPRLRVISGCWLLKMGSGNLSQVLCKSNKHPYPLSHLSNPVLSHWLFPVSIPTFAEDREIDRWIDRSQRRIMKPGPHCWISPDSWSEISLPLPC